MNLSLIGNIAIYTGLILSAYSIIAAGLGLYFGLPNLLVSAKRALYSCAFVVIAASSILIYAFITHNYTLKYVAEHSNNAMPTELIWVAFYSGNEGSLLYILTVLCIFTGILFKFNLRGTNRYVFWAVIILGLFQIFHFFMLAFFVNPFTIGDTIPVDGIGINPLLRHPAMFIHPPLLMAGLVGISIPFTLLFAQMLAKQDTSLKIYALRVWTLIIWAILGFGILIGAWWAYTILGWGGYWGWDPIENVALMPWIVLTTSLHTLLTQRRRGMFKSWNVVLIAIAFIVALLGMYINRGGPVVSVHSFATSTVGTLFLGNMAFWFVFALGAYIKNSANLKSQNKLESIASKEASFLFNNFLMLSVVFIVLWGVLYPVISELALGRQVSVGAPFFNRTTGPVLLAILFLMGIGPLLPWRKSTRTSLMRFLFPLLGGVACAVILLIILPISNWLAILSFSVITFSFTTIIVEWYYGTKIFIKNKKDVLLALWKYFNGSRTKNGAYLVHVGILILALGVTGTQFFDIKDDVSLELGQTMVFGQYRVDYVDQLTSDFPDHTKLEAVLEVYRIDSNNYPIENPSNSVGTIRKIESTQISQNDSFVGTLNPSLEYFFNFNQVSLRAGIFSNVQEDLYIIPREFFDDGRVTLRTSINPLAIWLWISGIIIFMGTIIALYPSKTRKIRHE